MDQSTLARAPWRLVIPGRMYDTLRRHLFPGDGDEHGAVIAAGMAILSDGRAMLFARDLHLAVDGKDYVPGKRGYRMLRAEFIRERIAACRDQRLVYLAIHNHGGTTSVGFSGDDYRSHERGYPALLDIANGMPIGALVFAQEAIAGDIWLPGSKRVELEAATVVGQRRSTLRPCPLKSDVMADPTYHRQALLFGESGQAILRGASVGIIGLGGVGSLIAEYLGRLGVGHFVLIDPDRVEPSNLSRVVAATRWDALCFLQASWAPAWLRARATAWATHKVDIAARVIRRANPSARIEAYRGDVQEPRCARALLGCDYLFLAADTMSARLVFNQIVHQYLIPGAQIGSKVSVVPATGAVSDVFSVVRPVSPDLGCLWCNQLISPSRLQEEAQTQQERHAQRYVDDPDVAAPSVITLNAIGAAHAANDFLFYMTGLRSPEASPFFYRHTPAVRRSSLDEPRQDRLCTECGCGTSSRRAQGDGATLTLMA